MRGPSSPEVSTFSPEQTEDGTIRVLVVDDDPGSLELEGDRFTVVTETSAADGLDRLAAGNVDCILSSYDLPRTDGLEFLETVREEYGDVPFILYTDSGSEQLASDAISAGVTEYLPRDAGTESHESLADCIDSAVFAISDVTEQFERTQELERYREFVRHSPDFTLVLDEEGTVEYQSPVSDALADSEPRDLVDETPETYVHPDDRDRVRADFERALDSDPGEVIRTELRIRDTSGEYRWYENRATNHLGRDPIDGILVTSREITGRKQTEQSLTRYASTVTQLQETTRKLLNTKESTAVADVAIEGIEEAFEFDVAGMWLHSESQSRLEPAVITERGGELIENPPMYSAGGRSLSWDAFQNQTTRVIDSMDDYESRHNPETPIRSELIVPVGEYGVLNIGSTEPCAFSERDRHRVEVWSNTVESALARVDRLQRLREREAELQRERNRLDEFASFVSHDLRNPLNVATGYLDLAASECESPHLEDVERALNRMELLIADLLELARQGATVGETEKIRLRQLLSQCWNSVETHDAELAVRTESAIQADRSRLMSAVENLIRNAVEHGSTGVTVTVGRLDGGDGFYIADDGPGIPEDEREAVFESGYSTADDGTGLGLAIVEQVVDAHGWDIHVTESSEGGARFEIADVELTE